VSPSCSEGHDFMEPMVLTLGRWRWKIVTAVSFCRRCGATAHYRVNDVGIVRDE
jgi:hypothetical protein